MAQTKYPNDDELHSVLRPNLRLNIIRRAMWEIGLVYGSSPDLKVHEIWRLEKGSDAIIFSPLQQRSHNEGIDGD